MLLGGQKTIENHSWALFWYTTEAPFMASSTPKKSTALSTLEAEIISANEGANEGPNEIAYMEKLWEDVGHQKYIPVLYCDNDAAVQFAKDSQFLSQFDQERKGQLMVISGLY
ncbi:hypothetical protein K3495_g17109 [Podosphaera aphanis]|nr:hypothetical protein K3495_g17109 [Podosphaera aphanis]